MEENQGSLYAMATKLIQDKNFPRVQAVSLILAERTEQETTHGYTRESDRQQDLDTAHAVSPLALAAAAYLIRDEAMGTPDCWPWDLYSFKPHPQDRLKELTKAAALVLAAMEQEIIKRGEKS